MRQQIAGPLRVLDVDIFHQATVLATKMQDDMIAFDLLQKVRLGIVGWIVTTPRNTPEERSCARMSKRGAEIADDVTKLRIAVVALCEPK